MEISTFSIRNFLLWFWKRRLYLETICWLKNQYTIEYDTRLDSLCYAFTQAMHFYWWEWLYGSWLFLWSRPSILWRKLDMMTAHFIFIFLDLNLDSIILQLNNSGFEKLTLRRSAPWSKNNIWNLEKVVPKWQLLLTLFLKTQHISEWFGIELEMVSILQFKLHHSFLLLPIHFICIFK